MPDSNPYSKSFLGSLLIHFVLLSFLILSFNQRVPLSTPTSSDSIIQAVVLDAQEEPDAREAERLHQAQQALQLEQQQAKEAQKKQMVQKKIEAEAKAAQLQRDMLEAKKEAAPQEPPKKVESLAPEKQDLAVVAVEEERLAENERLKQVHLTQAKEQKKRDQQIKEQKALKAAAALKAKEAALKTKLAADKAKAAEKSRMAAEKTRLAAHQKQINTAVATVVSAWSAKIESNRRSMSAFQSLAQELSCKVSLHILPDGSVRAQLVQSSGNALYDDLALKAIYKAEPFALPDDPEVRNQVKAIEFNFLNDT